MAWRAMTPEAEREQKRRSQQEYRESLEAQIADKRRSGSSTSATRASGASPAAVAVVRRDGKRSASDESQPVAVGAAAAPAAPGAAAAPAAAAATPAAPPPTAQPRPSPTVRASAARFEPRAPSPLPAGTPRRLHSLALLPAHEQEERHALREKQNAAAAALRAQMVENEQRRAARRRLEEEQLRKEEMALERAAAEWHGPAPTTSSDGWLNHDELPVGRHRQVRERAVAAAARMVCERSRSLSVHWDPEERGAITTIAAPRRLMVPRRAAGRAAMTCRQRMRAARWLWAALPRSRGRRSKTRAGVLPDVGDGVGALPEAIALAPRRTSRKAQQKAGATSEPLRRRKC